MTKFIKQLKPFEVSKKALDMMSGLRPYINVKVVSLKQLKKMYAKKSSAK